MQHRPTRRLMLAALTAGATASAASDRQVFASVKTMEARDGLTVFTWDDALSHRWRGIHIHDGGTVWPAVSPDARAMCWSDEYLGLHRSESSFLTVDSLKAGIQRVWLEGYAASAFAISSGPDIIITSASPRIDPSKRKLFAIDLRSAMRVLDLTPSVPSFEWLEVDSISGSGDRAVLGSQQQIQVIEVPSGKTVYAGLGSIPRLSPDGTRLAFIHKQRLYIRSLANGSTIELLKGKRVMGAGGWSPDGQLLLAGAWTRLLAIEKRQIAVNTNTGRYTELGVLGEGDYGEKFFWISTRLMAR